ncbi:hypothetical protein V495_02401 [Pseudogymnoascus sp. VKM F-4514 (FW-929)]|nr:hypothetical protein V495_02401 [Pseudogymnoascus sp. VKM F-4514 (FW-929)]KFY51317.1 hypothetical protein V497_09238 [Pseudogymnoascus sp. VKM F-4516 (FW-969)]
MPVPFGVGEGDFIAVGKLIAKVAAELRKNGEAAPMYQSLLLELEALDRALCQLQTLQPSRHELLQLNSIRATALSCERPLREFLNKISKFQPTMGTFATKDNRFKGFPRRMQWRMMYKDDVVELRSILGSHVSTINLLLMTQTVRSITIADNDRAELADGLGKKIMAHRGLLEEVKGKIELSGKQQSAMSTQLEHQTKSLQRLETDAEILDGQIKEQNVALKEVRLLASRAELKITSILSATTDILTLITSGISTLQAIATHLLNTFELVTNFTAEMRVAMGELLQQFWSLQNTLSRIEQALPMQVYLPIIQLTDAFGDNLALPYQLCRTWSAFQELLRAMYINRQGWFRVKSGQYLIMQARGGQLIKREAWESTVREGDHLSMCITLKDIRAKKIRCLFPSCDHLSMGVRLEDIRAKEGRCPFPSCDALADGAENRNGGKVCQECGRWSLKEIRWDLSPLQPMARHGSRPQAQKGRLPCRSMGLNNDAIAEDVENYRQIYVPANDYDDMIRMTTRNLTLYRKNIRQRKPYVKNR